MEPRTLKCGTVFTPGDLPDLPPCPQPHWKEEDLRSPFMERLPLLKSIEGSYQCETSISTVRQRYAFKSPKTADALEFYDELERKQARLPKVSKWVAGLWPKDEDVQSDLAGLGKLMKPQKIYISTRCEDILRASATTHFRSCLVRHNGEGTWASYNYDRILCQVCETANGIAVAYMVDDEGMFKARTFIFTVATLKEPDAHFPFVMNGHYGENLTERLMRALVEISGKAATTGGRGNHSIQFKGGLPFGTHFDQESYPDLVYQYADIRAAA
jgi:hypothetical protein